MRQDPEALIRPLIAAAQEAGRAVAAIARSQQFEVATKSDASPVTTADLAAQAIILQHLGALAPEIPVLSEEQEQLPFAERRAWRRLFVVDPLDGTREFLKRNGEFTINIALVEEGVPTLGVVFAPMMDRTYWGATFLGAFRIDDEGEHAIRIGVEPNDLRVVVSRSHPGERLAQFLAALPNHRPVEVGSSLKFCRVAEGSADFYPRLSPTMEWDTAAGDAVLRAAGGRVLDLEGRPLTYNKEDLRNPSFVALGGREVPWRVAWEKTANGMQHEKVVGR
jgi:3'(2'), 5'-bisphosphate nucleotidase